MGGPLEITSLGHAGFLVESPTGLIVMDPWLGPAGAFGSSWFQLPPNHHLLPLVEAHMHVSAANKPVTIYVSHDHKDHFDAYTLSRLTARTNARILIPRFRSSALKREITRVVAPETVEEVDDCAQVTLGADFTAQLFIEDDTLERDSSILVRFREATFLNINDCKLFDRLHEVTCGMRVSVFAAQFSNASWYPTCFGLTPESREMTLLNKRRAKFGAVLDAIEDLNPSIYVASAGPPRFLDPALVSLNEPLHFPGFQEIADYLDGLMEAPTQVAFANPGGSIRIDSNQGMATADSEMLSRFGADARLKEQESTAHAYLGVREQSTFDRDDIEQAMRDVGEEFLAKAREMGPCEDAPPLILSCTGKATFMIVIDLEKGTLAYVSTLPPEPYLHVDVDGRDLLMAAQGEISWADLVLSFRLRASRRPDVYDPRTLGLLIVERDDIPTFKADLATESDEEPERVVVHAAGAAYLIQRRCPHRGGDLSRGRLEDGHILVCPKHGWRFDLRDGGRCMLEGQPGIDAVEIDGLEEGGEGMEWGYT